MWKLTKFKQEIPSHPSRNRTEPQSKKPRVDGKVPDTPLFQAKDQPPPFELLLKTKEEMRDAFMGYVKNTFAQNTYNSYNKIFSRCLEHAWEACLSNDIDVIPFPARNQSVIKNHFENFLKTQAVKESPKYPRLEPESGAENPVIAGLHSKIIADAIGEEGSAAAIASSSKDDVELISNADKEFYCTVTWHVGKETVQFNIPKTTIKATGGTPAPKEFMTTSTHFCSCASDSEWCSHKLDVLASIVDPTEESRIARERKSADDAAKAQKAKLEAALEAKYPGESDRLCRVVQNMDRDKLVAELKKAATTKVETLGYLVQLFPESKFPAKMVEYCQRCHKNFDRNDENDKCGMPHLATNIEKLSDRDGRSRYYCVKCQKAWDEPLGDVAKEGGMCYEGAHETNRAVVRREGWPTSP